MQIVATTDSIISNFKLFSSSRQQCLRGSNEEIVKLFLTLTSIMVAMQNPGSALNSKAQGDKTMTQQNAAILFKLRYNFYLVPCIELKAHYMELRC